MKAYRLTSFDLTSTNVCCFPGLLSLLFALTGQLSITTPASAAIYKCVNEAGETTYTSAPCASDESTRRISANATAVAGLDCRIARKLSFATTRQMKQGESSARVFESHGGLDSLSPLVISLISYIYTFDGNEDVSTSRIATLATERCQVGSFGTQTRHCEIYPYEFIQQLGGCAAARDEAVSKSVSPVPTSIPGQRAVGTNPAEATEPNLGAAVAVDTVAYGEPSVAVNNDPAPSLAAARAANARTSCTQRIGETLIDTQRKMQYTTSSMEQQRLRKLQRQLRIQIERC